MALLGGQSEDSKIEGTADLLCLMAGRNARVAEIPGISLIMH